MKTRLFIVQKVPDDALETTDLPSVPQSEKWDAVLIDSKEAAVKTPLPF
jgi:hypothetical protein